MRSHKGNIPVLPQTKLCPHCPAKFTRTTHLNRHLRTHTGERLHRCDTCEAQFTRSDLLTRHKRSCGDPGHVSRTRRRSCQACAESKVKCDLQQPCGKCQDRGRECVFTMSGRTSRSPPSSSLSIPSPAGETDDASSSRSEPGSRSRVSPTAPDDTISLPDYHQPPSPYDWSAGVSAGPSHRTTDIHHVRTPQDPFSGAIPAQIHAQQLYSAEPLAIHRHSNPPPNDPYLYQHHSMYPDASYVQAPLTASTLPPEPRHYAPTSSDIRRHMSLPTLPHMPLHRNNDPFPPSEHYPGAEGGYGDVYAHQSPQDYSHMRHYSSDTSGIVPPPQQMYRHHTPSPLSASSSPDFAFGSYGSSLPPTEPMIQQGISNLRATQPNCPDCIMGIGRCVRGHLQG
ncbi:hypothetical protein CONPUDRAFT_135949 [Coniophora puteana RWD-64-598 SS2]|uniref:Zn(2)-C6 fungal-type domain-containing protein n=1 Tax=Coniophora puteana (strain RWD-64-598) TaxID=741705 RepID=A0A5M3MTT2_CONPW|nr:uncharacterized protein CONPUDRAFT_135949 [Coniophora puteana RWD-64-598 SS2]EIW82569.1 hypothetical protein CONPUDRAFT_135949 [Coniophora puteana RWD-64-598 SS2]